MSSKREPNKVQFVHGVHKLLIDCFEKLSQLPANIWNMGHCLRVRSACNLRPVEDEQVESVYIVRFESPDDVLSDLLKPWNIFALKISMHIQ